MTSDKTVEIADPFARQLMSRYLQRRREDIDRLRDALAAGDFEQIRTSGHNLYGSGSAYGLDEISTLGQKIENAALAQEPAELRARIDDLEALLDSLKLA